MTRLLRALTWLYPASFRAEYGDELVSVFAEQHRGASPIVALIAALVEFVPSAAAVHWDMLRQDLGYTFRALRRSPGFAATAVLVVALGVGANTAAFSVADYVLVRPLPFPQPDRLVKIWETTPGYDHMEFSPPNYTDVRAAATSFEGSAAYTTYAVNLVAGDEPQRVATSISTPDLFSVLRARPIIGRTFTASDTASTRPLVLGFDLWQTQFGGDPGVLGRHVDLDGQPFVVIGVMPASFHFPTRDIALWTIIKMDARDENNRTNNLYDVVARLRPKVSLVQARAELSVIAARLEREYPKENEKTRATAERLSDELSVRSKLLLVALCGAALCTLLLACANLANLLLARAVGREREIAVRAALGAGRERLVRQLVTESLVLAAIGGTVGIAVAAAAVPALAQLVPDTLPIARQPALDVRVLLFAAALIAATGLAFGVVPAMRAGRASSASALRDGARVGGGVRQRARTLLVAFEVAISVALLTSSGLLLRAIWRVQAIDPGFETAGILTAQTALPMPEYATVQHRTEFYTRVLGGIRALPGISSAAYITFLPMTMTGGIWPVTVKGQADVRTATNTASFRMVTPGFFATLRIPVRTGRDVAGTDDQTHPFVAVVSESFARRYWPAQDPIGKQFTFALHERTVVGIVGDIRVRGLERTSEPQVYVPYAQVPDSEVVFYSPKDLVVRSSLPVSSLLPEIRRIVHATDPKQPVSNVATLKQLVANETASRFAQLRVLGVLALVALLLAGVGLHGLLSFTVSSRVREIGVRVALGAEPRTILRMVLSEGLVLSIGGLVPGMAAAYWAGHAVQALLAGVAPADPTTFVVSIVVCVGTAVAGCVRPALRAASVDPASALRSDG